MRTRIVFAALLVLLPTAAFRAQAAKLKGIVRVNEELVGLPVPDVEISAVDGANPTKSKTNGTFTLEFPNKQPGDMVEIVVQKPGYVVVNDVQLHRRLLPRDSAETLTILISREADREEMALRFYRLKSLAEIKQTYQKRLKELEAKNQANAAALAKLRKDRDHARTTAEKLAEESARLKPEVTPELNKQALSLFLDGKVDEALQLLDIEKLGRVAESARQRKAEADREIAGVVQSYLLRAKLLATRFRFDDAEKTYQAATATAPDSFDAWHAFGDFSQDLNHFPKALEEYLHALELARKDGTNANVAKALNSLGILHNDQNRMDDARMAYDEALKIYRDLAQKNPDISLPDVAMTLNNLGLLHRDQNRMDDARKAFDEALKIYRDLVQKNSDTYRPELAGTLNNLGLLHHDQNRMDDARKVFDEALKIYRDLAQKNPDTYLSCVALTLNNLGLLHRDQSRMDDARKVFDEALKIYRDLTQKNPDTYLSYVAGTLNNLGVLHSDQSRMSEARKAYDEALTIRRDLAQKNPDTYLSYVAMTLNNLGLLHSDQNRMDDARKAYDEALEIFRDLAQKNPDTFLPYVAATLNNLGLLHRDENRLDEARNALEEALSIIEDFAKRDPLQYQPYVERLKRNLDTLPEKAAPLPEAQIGACQVRSLGYQGLENAIVGDANEVVVSLQN